MFSFFRTIFSLLCALPLCLFLCSSAYGADGVLKTDTGKPVVDGVVENGEYGYSYETEDMTLLLSRSPGIINAALVARTEGWVGIGFKSSVMDDAEILIGYVKGGKAAYKEQIGTGKRHKDKDLAWVKSLVLSESGGKTTLEVELVEKGVVDPGSESLSLIIAFGNNDSFSSFHRMKKGLTVELED